MIQTAFHEAGHAASIYLGNKAKQLPPVFFQIQISSPSDKNDQLYSAKVTDGRLIQHLPLVGIEAMQHPSIEEKRSYQAAYEADVINLLAGPLAEAKYISQRDDELLTPNIINIHGLNYYGGSSDVKKANAYLTYFIASEQEREIKMRELFLQAFNFVDDDESWLCIKNLAEHILNSKQEVLSCEEAIEVIDFALAA